MGLYVIWSKKNQGSGGNQCNPVILWWAPMSSGYTRYLNEAGRYTHEEAMRIEAGGSSFAVPEAVAQGMVRQAVHDEDLIRYLQLQKKDV